MANPNQQFLDHFQALKAQGVSDTAAIRTVTARIGSSRKRGFVTRMIRNAI